jgi:hypothetical protein
MAEGMIEKVHDHIINELDTNTRTDLIFVLTGIILNLVILGANSGIAAAASRGNAAPTIIMFVLVALLLVINLIVELGLIKGRQTRTVLLNGLIKMYKDQNVEGYYDPSLLGAYHTRYTLFMLAVLMTGLVALIIPFVLLVVL